MAEAYIHLSVEDTFGKVIAEAMSCGTVPVTFNSTACGEISGSYGIIVAPHDVNAIIRSLSKLQEKQKKSDEIINKLLSWGLWLLTCSEATIVYL